MFVEKPIEKTKNQTGPVVNPGPYKRTIGAINGGTAISHMNESQAASQKIRPSRWFYLIALGLIAAGTICGYKIVLAAINTMQSGLTRAIFPGETLVSFQMPGDYKIYYENQSEFNGRVFDTGQRVPGLSFTVVNNETQETLPLFQPSMSETYNINGRTGRLVFWFRVVKPGSYTVVGRYDDGQKHDEAVFAVGNPHIGRFVGLILGGIACIFVFGGGAVITIILIEVRRYSSEKKLKAAAASSGFAAPSPPL